MTRTSKATKDLTPDELDIIEHAKSVGLHVKKAGRHSGHMWYCFDCKGWTTDHICGKETPHKTDHISFDSNGSMKRHLMNIHDVHWNSSYYMCEDAS